MVNCLQRLRAAIPPLKRFIAKPTMACLPSLMRQHEPPKSSLSVSAHKLMLGRKATRTIKLLQQITASAWPSL